MSHASVIAKHLLGPRPASDAAAARLYLVPGCLGSGKTYLLRELLKQFTNHQQPQQVLLLTATSKAAQTARREFDSKKLLVESIESCATQVLATASLRHHNNCTALPGDENKVALDLHSARVIRDRSELFALFSKQIFNLPLSSSSTVLRPLLDPTANVNKILDLFAWLKRANLTPSEYVLRANARSDHAVLAQCFQEWNQYLMGEGLYEPEDLIARAKQSLQNGPTNTRRGAAWWEQDTVLLMDDVHLLLPNQLDFVLHLAKSLRGGTAVLFADLDQADAYWPCASPSSSFTDFHCFDALPHRLPEQSFAALLPKKGIAAEEEEEMSALREWVALELDKPNNVAVVCTRSSADRDLLFQGLQRTGNVQVLGRRDYWLDSVEVRSLLALINLVLRGHLTADRDLFAVWTSPLFADCYGPSEAELEAFAARDRTGDMLEAIAALGGSKGERLKADIQALGEFAAMGRPLSLLCAEALKRSGLLHALEFAFDPIAANRIAQFCQLIQRIEYRISPTLQATSLEALDYLDLYISSRASGSSEEEMEEEIRAGMSTAAQRSVVYLASMHTVCATFNAGEIDSLCLARATDQKLPMKKRNSVGLALPWEDCLDAKLPALDKTFFEAPKEMDRRLLAAVCNRTKSSTVYYSLGSGEVPSPFLLPPNSSISTARKRIKTKLLPQAETPPRPISDALPRVNLSFSTLNVYESCPRKYWYSKVMGLVVPSNVRMVNGKSLHYGIEAHYNAQLAHRDATQIEDHAQLLKAAETAYLDGFDRAMEANPEGFVSRVHLQQIKAQGLATIQAFHTRFISKPQQEQRQLVQAEQRFEFDWKEEAITITGFVDLVEREGEDGGGGLVLTDFKSNVMDRAKLNRLGRNNEQLAMYAWFCEREWGELPKLVGIESIETGQRFEEPPTRETMDAIQAKLVRAAHGIRAKQFAAKPAYMDCTFCSFNKLCPNSIV